MQPRLAVVSYLYGDEFSPRGVRTRELVNGLGRDWRIEAISGPPQSNSNPTGIERSTGLHRAVSAVSRSLSIDRHELWSKRRFSSWNPEADLALLIGYPFSPIAEAARTLARRQIPYVVDAGDPWVLTGEDPLRRHLGLWRARRAERHLWDRAAGGIVTTTAQADALNRLFPDLPILVRPNGYQQVSAVQDGVRSTAAPPGQALRLVHFGRIYLPRIDIRPMLLRLAQSGRWPSIVFCQFGHDAEGILDRLPPKIGVEIRPPVPWREAITVASGFDLALVVGNQNPDLLPSKVIEYLTLPIPRLAIVGNSSGGAIREYVSDKPGWLVIASDDASPDAKIAAHCVQGRLPDDLKPPETESWPSVTRKVGSFLRQCYEATLA